jgi:hypothetical protein
MKYTKPELHQLGVAESLVLGGSEKGIDSGANGLHTKGSSAFEFEE